MNSVGKNSEFTRRQAVGNNTGLRLRGDGVGALQRAHATRRTKRTNWILYSIVAAILGIIGLYLFGLPRYLNSNGEKHAWEFQLPPSQTVERYNFGMDITVVAAICILCSTLLGFYVISTHHALEVHRINRTNDTDVQKNKADQETAKAIAEKNCETDVLVAKEARNTMIAQALCKEGGTVIGTMLNPASPLTGIVSAFMGKKEEPTSSSVSRGSRSHNPAITDTMPRRAAALLGSTTASL